MANWWQRAIIYQVYLRSFYDSNADGIGDLKGVEEKLDYIRSLGADTVWISPHYDSPMDDNGYDIRDFYRVSPDYGDLDDFRSLIAKAREKGMRIITDMVLNHTSDEHPWFLAAKDPSHPEHETYKDFYIWHAPRFDEAGNPRRPTRWIGWFGNPAWTYNEATGEYYLHIFSRKMPDLNWRNPKVREAMKNVIRYWIDLGVDGFRLDATNHLEKNWDFPDGYPGYENFSSLERHHEYLQELGRELFEPNNLMIIGEAGGATREEALRYAGFDSPEFNMLVHFEHCWVDVDETNEKTPGKWAKGTLDLPKLKESFQRWHDIFHGKGWNAIYWHNHDHPRIVSHYGDDGEHWERSAKLLAFVLYLMPGTPIVYYGEEIGMTNVDYEDLQSFRDVEVFTEYENFRRNGASHETAMQALRDRSRDNARTPMQWSAEAHAGFSESEPWIPVVANYPSINVARQEAAEDSILHTYRRVLKLRRESGAAFGRMQIHALEDEQTFVYTNTTQQTKLLVVANFSKAPVEIELPDPFTADDLYEVNRKEPDTGSSMQFAPYEARIYKIAR